MIAAVQFVFTLACGYLVAAGNVFFRDLGNVETHLLRLWWFLSPGPVQPRGRSTSCTSSRSTRRCGRSPGLNPFAILFEAYRKVIYGSATPKEPPGLPNFASLAFLLVASVIFLAFTTYVFKRLEPNFAKVI